jgi:hypothetical protein
MADGAVGVCPMTEAVTVAPAKSHGASQCWCFNLVFEARAGRPHRHAFPHAMACGADQVISKKTEVVGVVLRDTGKGARLA